MDRRMIIKQLEKWILVGMLLGILLFPLISSVIEHRLNSHWEAIWLTWSGDPSTTITINWHWGYTGKAYVSYWNLTFSGRIEIEANELNHVQLMGLTPGTKYYFEIGYYTELGAPKSWSGELYFWTAPRISMEFSVLVQSDTHAPGYGAFERFVNVIKGEEFNFTIHCGDLVDRSYEEFWADFFVKEGDLLKKKPIMPTIGNHEIYYGDKSAFYNYFSLPNNEKWYAFRYANAMFITLYVADYYNFELTPEEKLFLLTTIEQAKEERLWIIVYFHIPPIQIFPAASNPKITGELFELLNETKPDIVLSGHAHAYARKTISNVTYITVGTAGGISNIAILNEKYPDAYSFENGYLILKFDGNVLYGYYKSLRGEIIDFFTLQK